MLLKLLILFAALPLWCDSGSRSTTYYYDAEGQLLQEVSENSVGGMSRKDMSYDMPGRLLWSRERHSDGLGEEHVLEWSTGYDMYGRQMGVIVSLDSLRPYSEMYDYDLRSGFRTRVVTGGYTVSESYDIRGWLAGLSGNRFFEELSYLPDGSICKVRWSHGGDTLGYEYSYDGYGRLSGATMPEAAAAHSYEERGILYDGNGNILSLQRTAAGTIVDDLSYSYSGNRLASLTENIRAVPEGDVYGGGSQATMGYSYDSNGNLLEDERRGLLFGYNGLGLLETVSGTGGSLQARYRWLADGTKLGVRDGSGENGYDYAGSFVYRVSGGERELEGVLWEGGVIRLDSTGKQVARYFICDHLGSVRVVVENGVVVERNDYYPFGARHERGDYVASDNRYKFNGKEEQLTGSLGWLDYGARMYDVGIGRWWSVDPLGEEYYPYSPFAYCLNNPIILLDPEGTYMDWFMNELSGDVYYNSAYGEDDVWRIGGEGWTWLGGNGLFSGGTLGDFLSDWLVLLHGSGDFRLRIENVGMGGDTKFNIEALIQGENAKTFMKSMRYDLKPKEYIYQQDIITDLHPEAIGQPMEITIDNSRILEVLSYQYVHETANLKESEVLKIIKDLDREIGLIKFAPVVRVHETMQLKQRDIYDDKFHINPKLVDGILKVIPLQELMEQVTKRIMK